MKIKKWQLSSWGLDMEGRVATDHKGRVATDHNRDGDWRAGEVLMRIDGHHCEKAVAGER